MKDYIYNRYKRAIRECHTQVSFNYNYFQADYCQRHYKDSLKRIQDIMDIKSMPSYLKSQVQVAFDTLWQYQITNETLYPIIWEGKLYSKWSSYPESAKEYCTTTGKAIERIAVFNKHFTEGMTL